MQGGNRQTVTALNKRFYFGISIKMMSNDEKHTSYNLQILNVTILTAYSSLKYMYKRSWRMRNAMTGSMKHNHLLPNPLPTTVVLADSINGNMCLASFNFVTDCLIASTRLYTRPLSITGMFGHGHNKGI
jgi:hypothetical protein